MEGNFDLVIPEDVFFAAKKYRLDPIIHFKTVLPTARRFNESAFLLDIYKKWGAKYVILGDKPNTKHGWPSAGWHDDTLVEDFLDRFIPLASYALKIGLVPIMAPLQPGGDYWDSAFMELVLHGLKQRKMANILDGMVLSSYGYTYQKPLSWGSGGPERWPGSKPYTTPEGQEDQLGFHHFEWMQAVGQRVTGQKIPVVILDAGNPEPKLAPEQQVKVDDTLRQIITGIRQPEGEGSAQLGDDPLLNDLVLACTFSLDSIKSLLGADFTQQRLDRIFQPGHMGKTKLHIHSKNHKHFEHYLLLPAYASGVADVVLNKVRPLIKKYHPTVGFSLQEAIHASKVSIFPDPFLFTDEQINHLRAAGCEVELLPQTGIEIATLVQD
ncbi:MAG: hypothetical protein ACNA70_06720 [Brevefilum sp.]